MRKKAEDRLGKFKEKGTRVSVRYDDLGYKGGQWWTGTVDDSRKIKEDDVEKDQICIIFDKEGTNAARLDKLEVGSNVNMEEWVDLVTDVRLIQ